MEKLCLPTYQCTFIFHYNRVLVATDMSVVVQTKLLLCVHTSVRQITMAVVSYTL